MFAPFMKSGLGLHTGVPTRIVVEMGFVGTGVSFFLEGSEGDAIPGGREYVDTSAQRCTALAKGQSRISTVEHLLAALGACGETDVRITVDGPEIPILDGSALPFMEALEEMGSREEPKFIEIPDEVVVRNGESVARMTPLKLGEDPVISVEIDFPRSEFGTGKFSFYPGKDSFRECIAPARTFAVESEVQGILDRGLAKGGSLDCALIIGQDGPVNPGGMRFAEEPARHKILDAMGDLLLLGGLPLARVTLLRPGHLLLHQLTGEVARRLMGCCR
jgi:UDP-3-O-[3-hydroxymyristoyl] N-acetylglucosamine deacetylase